jgi:hypothetical protein
MATQNSTLTQDQAKDLFEYRNGDLYWKISKGQAKIGSKVGCFDKEGYRVTIINYKNYKVHRLIFMMHYGFFPQQVDHINGNKSDNHIENLREATHSFNECNKAIQKNNTSGAKGVSWKKDIKKWVVRVGINKKQYRLGCFEDLELASLVAEMAREKYHKEYARHY